MKLAAAGRAKAKAGAAAKAKGQAKAKALAAKAKASAKAKAKASAKAKAKAKAKASAKKRPAAKPSKEGEVEAEAENPDLPDEPKTTPKKRRSTKGEKTEQSAAPPSDGMSAECNEMVQSGLIPPTFGGRGKPTTSSWALEKYCRTAYAFRKTLEKSIIPGTKHRAQARG